MRRSISAPPIRPRWADWLGLTAVLLIAVVGLSFVKWSPYYHRAFTVTLAPISLPSLLMIDRVFPRRVLALVVATVATGLLAAGHAIAFSL